MSLAGEFETVEEIAAAAMRLPPEERGDYLASVQDWPSRRVLDSVLALVESIERAER